MSDLAPSCGVVGIVARAALERGDRVRGELESLGDRPLVKGVRRILQAEPHGFTQRPDFLDGTSALVDANMSFDACVIASQLPDVSELARRTPELRIVLDHLGKPKVGTPIAPVTPIETAWLDDIQDLARHENVTCKISGLPAESPSGWSPAQFRPFMDAALEAFGPDRLILGGDWPVSGSYGDWFGFVESWLAPLSADEADAIRWQNARTAYRLPTG